MARGRLTAEEAEEVMMTRTGSDSSETSGGPREKSAEASAASRRPMIVFCTAGDQAGGQTLARTLVEERLAACVSRVPVQSTYRWKEAVVNEAEVLLLIKTEASQWDTLQRRIGELHAYECPEIFAIDAAEVEANYLAWMLAACGSGG